MCMNATLSNGDEWTGEKQEDYWICRDKNGNLYETRETPAYRIVMDNATQTMLNGRLVITPINHLS